MDGAHKGVLEAGQVKLLSWNLQKVGGIGSGLSQAVPGAVGQEGAGSIPLELQQGHRNRSGGTGMPCQGQSQGFLSDLCPDSMSRMGYKSPRAVLGVGKVCVSWKHPGCHTGNLVSSQIWVCN